MITTNPLHGRDLALPLRNRQLLQLTLVETNRFGLLSFLDEAGTHVVIQGSEYVECLAALLIDGCLGLAQSTLLNQLSQLVQEMGLTVHLYSTFSSLIFDVGLKPGNCLLSKTVCELITHICNPELLKTQYLTHLS